MVPLLCPTSNGVSGVGEGRDLYVASPGASSPDALRMFRVLGRLVGCALRTGVRLAVAIAPPFWKVWELCCGVLCVCPRLAVSRVPAAPSCLYCAIVPPFWKGVVRLSKAVCPPSSCCTIVLALREKCNCVGL